MDELKRVFFLGAGQFENKTRIAFASLLIYCIAFLINHYADAANILINKDCLFLFSELEWLNYVVRVVCVSNIILYLFRVLAFLGRIFADENLIEWWAQSENQSQKHKFVPIVRMHEIFLMDQTKVKKSIVWEVFIITMDVIALFIHSYYVNFFVLQATMVPVMDTAQLFVLTYMYLFIYYDIAWAILKVLFLAVRLAVLKRNKAESHNQNILGQATVSIEEQRQELLRIIKLCNKIIIGLKSLMPVLAIVAVCLCHLGAAIPYRVFWEVCLIMTLGLSYSTKQYIYTIVERYLRMIKEEYEEDPVLWNSVLDAVVIDDKYRIPIIYAELISFGILAVYSLGLYFNYM